MPIPAWRFVAAAILLTCFPGCSTPVEQLSTAVDRGDSIRVAELLSSQQGLANLDLLLVTAASKGQDGIVKQLLEAGAKPDSGSALITAAKMCSLDTIQLLLDRGANVNKQQSAVVISNLTVSAGDVVGTVTFHVDRIPGAGNSALSVAIMSKRLPVLRLLLERGADRTTTVVYQDGDLLELPGILRTSHNINFVQDHGLLFVRSYDGDFTTNMTVVAEKRASLAELAKMFRVSL